MKRLLPAPLLSASLFALWLVLNRTTSAGHLLIAFVVALAMPLLLAPLRPMPVRIRRPVRVVRLILSVGMHVVMSNYEVGKGSLRRRRDLPRGGFAHVPLALHDPHGLAALAMITTVIPGTVWSQLAPDRSTLLLHVFDLQDEAKFVAWYKAHFEQPLVEIFQ